MTMPLYAVAKLGHYRELWHKHEVFKALLVKIEDRAAGRHGGEPLRALSL